MAKLSLSGLIAQKKIVSRADAQPGASPAEPDLNGMDTPARRLANANYFVI